MFANNPKPLTNYDIENLENIVVPLHTHIQNLKSP